MLQFYSDLDAKDNAFIQSYGKKTTVCVLLETISAAAASGLSLQ